jgi:hypothetical protein
MKKSRPYKATLIKGHVRNRLIKRFDRTKQLSQWGTTYGIVPFQTAKYNIFLIVKNFLKKVRWEGPD